MKVVFVAAVASLVVFYVSANEDGKKELYDKSKAFMNMIYKNVIKEFKQLKASGKTHSPEDITNLTAAITAHELAQHIAESTDLINLIAKLETSGEVKDFKIYDQGNRELKKELNQVASGLIKKDDLSPRFIGALVMGVTQLLTDMVRMMFTRYGEMPDSQRAQFNPQG